MSSAAIDIKAESRAAFRTVIKMELRTGFRGKKFTGGEIGYAEVGHEEFYCSLLENVFAKVYRFNVA